MKRLALLLFSIGLLTFIACNKDDEPKTQEEQIADCDFINSNGTFSVNGRSINSVGLFKVTDNIDKSKTTSIALYACDDTELHLVQIGGFSGGGLVLENGTYNLSQNDDVILTYTSGDITSVTQGSISGGFAESGTITITDNSVSFDVVALNPFTYSNITLKGEGNF